MAGKIRTLIVDDEPHARIRIRQLLRLRSDFEIIGECANGKDAVECILADKPDLVFLDVQMPRLTGLDVCEAISSAANLPLLIFVTAYDGYALKAFELHAIDYLLKPFDKDRFEKSLAHARDQLRRADKAASARRLNAMLEDVRSGFVSKDRLVLKENGKVILVRCNAIDWIEADGNYLRLHVGENSHHVRGTLARIETQLPSENFMRISRSVLLNLDRVKELQPLFYGDYMVILENGARLNMSRNYRDRVETLLARAD